MLEFLEDYGNASTNTFNKFRAKPRLILDWVEFEPQLINYRKTISILEKYNLIKHSANLNIEIFVGRNGKKLKPDALPPYNHIHYKWLGKGVHHKDALQINGAGGLGRIVPGTRIDVGPQGLGYYRAKVEIYNSEFPFNNGWKAKQSDKSMSTFFPDSWTKQKLQQELAIAFINKISKDGLWKGKMSDGVDVIFHYKNGIVESAYPSIK